MTTVNCPKCYEKVRMPDGASSQARVQCPLCIEEFDLAEALARLAPMLVVLNDPGATAYPSPVEKTFSGTDLVAEVDDDMASPVFSFETNDDADATAPAAPAFNFDDASEPSSPGKSSARRARKPRPQKSAVKEMFKVAGGGVIGLTIGQLILWWLPGDLAKDPLELAPKMPAFASFLVGPKFRSQKVAVAPPAIPPGPASASFGSFSGTGDTGELPSASFTGLANPNDNQGNKKNKNSKKKNGKKPPAANDTTANKNSTDDSESPTSSGEVGSEPLKPLVSEDDIFGGAPEVASPTITPPAFPALPDANEGEPSDNGDPIPSIPAPTPETTVTPETPAVTPPAVTPPAVTPPAVTPPSTTPPAVTGEFEGVRNAPTISVDQLSTRLSGAVSASIAMDTSSTEPVPKQRELAKEFYMQLASLGEAITFVGEGTADEQFDEVGKLAQEVGKQPAKLALIGAVAPGWMKIERPHNGLVVYGTVESIDFAAPYYTTSLTMPNKTVLKVVSINDPAGDYQPQSRVLILGSILDSPQLNLKDYQGAETTVVLDGLHATLPNEE